MSQTSTTWEVGDYDSPVIKNIQITDKLGQTTSTAYVYDFDECPPQTVCVGGTNQVVTNKQLDYGGKAVLRVISTAYKNYPQQHIFNLPTSVEVTDGNGLVFSRTDYAYDGRLLVNTPGVTQYSEPSTTVRGNVTQITRYKTPSWTETFNQIQFTIVTGGAGLCANCRAVATLETASGATLQAITLYDGIGSGWPSNSTKPVTATLNPVLKLSDIGRIVITQIQHIGLHEIPNNWDVNSVMASLLNNGASAQQIA